MQQGDDRGSTPSFLHLPSFFSISSLESGPLLAGRLDWQPLSLRFVWRSTIPFAMHWQALLEQHWHLVLLPDFP